MKVINSTKGVFVADKIQAVLLSKDCLSFVVYFFGGTISCDYTSKKECIDNYNEFVKLLNEIEV